MLALSLTMVGIIFGQIQVKFCVLDYVLGLISSIIIREFCEDFLTEVSRNFDKFTTKL